MIKLRNSKIDITKNIFRESGPKKSRQSFLRLDINERVSKFNQEFFNNYCHQKK